MDESTDVTYTGKVVGLGGDTIAEKYYINTIEDKVYITNNVVNGIGQRAYIKVDDEKYFSNYPETIDASRYVQYSSKNIEYHSFKNVLTSDFSKVKSSALEVYL